MYIKTEKEKETLLEAGRRLREVLDSVAKKIVPGVRVHDLDKMAYDMIIGYGDIPAFLNYQPYGSKFPYPATMCISTNEEIVHGIPSEDKPPIQEGDIVSIDCGLAHNGIFVDAACSVLVGKASERDIMLVTATRKALENALVVARAGNTVGDIGNAVEIVANETGFVVPPELGGHGVGNSQHEEPFIPNLGDPGEGEILEEGMVIAIEPIFFDGDDPRIKLAKDKYTYVTQDKANAAHFEHTILVTKGAPIIATGPMW